MFLNEISSCFRHYRFYVPRKIAPLIENKTKQLTCHGPLVVVLIILQYFQLARRLKRLKRSRANIRKGVWAEVKVKNQRKGM